MLSKAEEYSRDMQLRAKWYRVRTIRDDILEKARYEAEVASKQLEADFVAEVMPLLRGKKLTKVRLAEIMQTSRTTLDSVLKRFEDDPRVVGAKESTYTFEWGFMSNVKLIGVLPDDGGYESLAGAVEIRFVKRFDSEVWVAGDLVGFEEEFVNERYSAEVTAWALENGWEKRAVR